jgi:hypothetical protein
MQHYGVLDRVGQILSRSSMYISHPKQALAGRELRQKSTMIKITASAHVEQAYNKQNLITRLELMS